MPEPIDTTGGAYCALFMMFGPLVLALVVIGLLLLAELIRWLCRRKFQVLRGYDDSGRIICEFDYDDNVCSGSRTGETGALCGGCCRCIEMQMSHYGTRYEIVDEYRD